MTIQRNAFFAHNTDDWETPQDLFDALDNEFHFGIDVCASAENRKCMNFFDKNDDGLSKNWGGVRNYLVQSSLWESDQLVGAESIY